MIMTFCTMMTSRFTVTESLWFAIAWIPKVPPRRHTCMFSTQPAAQHLASLDTRRVVRIDSVRAAALAVRPLCSVPGSHPGSLMTTAAALASRSPLRTHPPCQL